MNKRITSSINRVIPHYPNVVGTLTDGAYHTISGIDIAFAVTPDVIPAGHPFEAVLLLQNTFYAEVDVLVRLIPPDRDLVGNNGVIATKIERAMRVGLRPAEVGVLRLPVFTARHTAPAGGYRLQAEIEVDMRTSDALRVRLPSSGWLNIEEFDSARQAPFIELQAMRYRAELSTKSAGLRGTLTGVQRSTLVAPFEITVTQAKSVPSGDFRPKYVPLWTDADLTVAHTLIDQTSAELTKQLVRLNRHSCYFPLVSLLQAGAENAEYRLRAGEAVLSAKLLVFILEMGIPNPLPGKPTPSVPRWVIKLAQLLSRAPDLVASLSVEQLLADHLFADLVYDAALHGLSILRVLTKDLIQPAAKTAEQAQTLSKVLAERGQTLTLAMLYCPLVLAGLTINARLLMPQEEAGETLELFRRAYEFRLSERALATDPIFTAAQDLYARGWAELNPNTTSGFVNL